MEILLLIISMIFFHIIDDFYLQGWLASAKQKEWWEKNAPDPLYKNDYIMALAVHGFSWSCMIHIPLIIHSYVCYGNNESIWISIVCSICINWAVHCIVDDRKANRKVINLVTDQLLHIIQIVWACIYVTLGAPMI